MSCFAGSSRSLRAEDGILPLERARERAAGSSHRALAGHPWTGGGCRPARARQGARRSLPERRRVHESAYSGSDTCSSRGAPRQPSQTMTLEFSAPESAAPAAPIGRVLFEYEPRRDDKKTLSFELSAATLRQQASPGTRSPSTPKSSVEAAVGPPPAAGRPHGRASGVTSAGIVRCFLWRSWSRCCWARRSTGAAPNRTNASAAVPLARTCRQPRRSDDAHERRRHGQRADRIPYAVTMPQALHTPQRRWRSHRRIFRVLAS